MKDGRTHLAHKAEHGVDMDTGAIVSVTVQDASDGDTATLPETRQVEAVLPEGAGVEEMVADKGHSDEMLVGLRGSESCIGAGAGSALLAGQETAAEACWQKALYARPCARAAGSSPATPPGRGGGAYFRTHV